MKLPSTASALAVSALLFALPALAQDSAVPTPSPSAVLSAIQYKGCYSDATGFEDQGPYTYQSAGWCQKVCGAINKPVMATQKGSNCWCADLLPASSAKVQESECNSPCDGFDQAVCGGETTWSVSLDGLLNNVGSQDGTSDSSSGSSGSSTKGTPTSGSKSTTASPSVITEAGQTIVVTATGDSQPTAKSSGGPSKAGIAAGAVAGVLAICALLGGLFFYLRARKRKSVEEAYRRNAAINTFATGGGRKQASEGSDSRLDPSIMVQRRQSDGSIADNQDYSRRILRVANPDGT